ncbi:clathrin adaptor complex small chain-domain-containing protein [Boletus edulis]|nr:clathrin adaptor complex small chain-domain-containing protein [Boletus edulis]
MIHAVLIFNTSGVPRLTKFYTPLHQSPQTVIPKIFSLISIRPAGLCNFLDAPELDAFLGPKDDLDDRWRVVYRNYATLYFVFSELGVLDLIQVFVEALDRAFENVCELDLVFHFDEVGFHGKGCRTLSHEMRRSRFTISLRRSFQGGLVLETNVEEISNSAKTASKARKDSFVSANPLALGAGVGARNGPLPTPLGWLTDKLTGVSGR